MRAALALLACCTCTTLAFAQPAAEPAPAVLPPAVCTATDFGTEVLYGDNTTQRCPKPTDLELDALRKRLMLKVDKDSRLSFEVLTALRDHVRATATGSYSAGELWWREALARRIDGVLDRAKLGQHVQAAFSAARAPTQDVDPMECLFVTGDAGVPGYACYVIAGAKPPQPVQGAARIEILILPSYAEAFSAYQSLGVAHAALVKLDVPALEEAIARLALAQKRWDNLRSKGYVQYPWELGASSAFARYRRYGACMKDDTHCTGEEGLDPESLRLILLHPGAGAGLQGFGKGGKPSADAALSLSLELLGFTHYFGDFDWYWGLSAGAIVDDGDFGDIRVGGFVHATRFLHAGYLLSVMRDETRWDATLFLSMDIATAFGVTFLE